MTRIQLIGLAAFASPQALWLLVFFVKHAYAMMLINDPMGVRLTCVGLGMQCCGAFLYVLLWRSLKAARNTDDDRHRRWNNSLHYLVGASIYFFFVVPAIFVVLAGPAAIQIANELRPGR